MELFDGDGAVPLGGDLMLSFFGDGADLLDGDRADFLDGNGVNPMGEGVFPLNWN